MDTDISKVLIYRERIPPLKLPNLLTISPTWGHVKILKIYIFTYTRRMVIKLVRVLTSGRRFSTQMRKSSPASCFFFSFSLLSLSLDVRSKVFYQLFIIGYPRSVGARMDLFNWTHKKLYDACGPGKAMHFSLFTATSIHKILKVTKIRNSAKNRKATQKIQLFNNQKTEKSSW